MKHTTMKACFAGISLLVSLFAFHPRCIAQCGKEENLKEWRKNSAVCAKSAEERLPEAICQLAIDEKLTECQIDSASKALKALRPPQQPLLDTWEATVKVAGVDIAKASTLTESLATAPPVPVGTIHTGSVAVLNGGHDYTVKAHGRSMQTDITGAPNTIYLSNFTDAHGMRVAEYPTPVLQTPLNWIITAHFEDVSGRADVDIPDPADATKMIYNALRTMTICTFEDPDGNCRADGKPIPVPSTPPNTTVYFEDSGYGQFYADTRSPESLKFHVTDACNGSNNCDHISQITIDTGTPPSAMYQCPSGTMCFIYLKYCNLSPPHKINECKP
jgi:hypothetical protein